MTEDEVGQHEPVILPHPPPAAALATGDLLPGAPVLAAATVDSDLDGTADTTVAPWGDGLVLATDLDHDGHADVVTRVGPEGVVTARHADVVTRVGPEGVVTARHADGAVHVEERPWGAPPPPAPSIDPRTGAWVRG